MCGGLLGMAVDNQTIKDASAEGTPLERYVNSHVGNFIHLFLTVLAVLVMAAACVALVQIVHYGFPQLWRASDEYQTLHQLLQNILLLAIAGELGLLLLFGLLSERFLSAQNLRTLANSIPTLMNNAPVMPKSPNPPRRVSA